MTAEIALLNRRALAFAADSAVTISDGTNSKIYNSAEKIFELSRASHIGLMLYNSLEFVGVPLDVLTRKFRSEADQPFATCKAACEAFLEYLCRFPRYKDNEEIHLRLILQDEIGEIAREHKRGFPEYFREYMKRNQVQDIDHASSEYLIKILNDHRDVHVRRPLPNFLSETDEAAFRGEYRNAITILVRQKLTDWAKDTNVLDAVFSWAFAVLKSDLFSESLTGLVFGGFGTSDLFPSLYSVELDGIFFGRIKCRVTNDVDIDRRGEHAKIIPFAQSEMVERFLFGLDDEMQSNITSYIRRSIDRALKLLSKTHGIDLSTVNLMPDDYANDVSRFVDRLKRRARDETLDMVDFMPKQELAYTAEAFITLTSIKRKVSSQQETVGGPIDVAIITQNEGFVWIKRKHYFERELNPAYDVRSFVSMKRSVDNDWTAKKGRGKRGKKAPAE